MLPLKAWYRFVGVLVKALYRLLYGRRMRWGRAFHMRGGFRATVDGGGRIVIGYDVFFNNDCAVHAMGLVRIGDGTAFGENVRIYDHNHRFSDPTVPIRDRGYDVGEVVVGSRCWIGSNVTLLKGARIGDGSVVGAGCVIDGEIPAGSVVRRGSAPRVEPLRPSTKSETDMPSAPLRVLVLDTVMDRGGAETMAMNYLRHMDRRKVTYDFLVNRDYRAAYEDEIESLGGRIYRMCPMYPQYFGRYKREFRRFLRDHPEYRVIHSNLEERSYFPLRIAAEMGVPVRIAHAHNRPVGFDAKLVVREYFRLRLPRYVTHMFACGQEAGDWLFGRRRRARVVQQRNAIDTARYRYDADTAAAVRAEFGVTDPDTLVVEHVGRFFPQKNHDKLIDVFAELHRIRPNSVLWLVGGGETDDRLKNEIRAKVADLGLTDAVRFLGVRDDVDRIMQGMDVFVLPSLYEGLPVTMIEAQAAGLPCVISDRVPAQCDVTGNVTVVPLEESARRWARAVLERRAHPAFADRAEGADLVKGAGYDIVVNARWLQDFYLRALERAEA
ncbi:glycosyltransferase [Bifidobacterium simiarum]|uniref:glycosyltransferase n=1 Tax=Bifidobacterium simiarum TaxID=2045441 RepID=UPI001F0ACD1B|nr:glycosyltransferase [Bifidobacterium simiarum]